MATTKSRNKKIFIVYDNLDIGGIQTKIIDIVNYLNSYYPQMKIIICLLYKSGRFCFKVNKNNLVLISTLSKKRFFRRFEQTSITIWLAYQIALHRPDLILTFISRPSILTIIAKNFIFWHHPKVIIGEDILTSKNLKNEPSLLLRQPLVRLIKRNYPLADKILVQTPVQKFDLVNNFNIHSPKVIVSPNWLPIDYTSTDTQQTTKDIDILYIGRMDPQKNLGKFLDIIYQVAKVHPKLVVKLVGSGSEEKILKKKAIQLEVDHQVTFLPPTENPKEFYQRSKILLLSSDYEGFPLTILEAIACGCFPISSDLPEVSLFFKNDKKFFIYSNIKQAVNLICHRLDNKTKSPLIEKYQHTIFQRQNSDIRKYIDEIIQ